MTRIGVRGPYLSSGAVARKLGVPYHRVFRALQHIPAPAKLGSDYLWTPADLRRLEAHLAGRAEAKARRSRKRAK
jgi:hypothetical protein